MRVARAPDILRGRAELHRSRKFGNQRPRIGADDVRSQYAVRRFVGEDLHEPICLAHRAGARIGGEREFADVVGDTCGFQLFLVLTDRGDLRPSIDHAGNGAVVYVPRLPGQPFGKCNAFLSALCASIGPAMASPIA